jgi:PBP1b-binding outer membrane lipoprotein LpoB
MKIHLLPVAIITIIWSAAILSGCSQSQPTLTATFTPEHPTTTPTLQTSDGLPPYPTTADNFVLSEGLSGSSRVRS